MNYNAVPHDNDRFPWGKHSGTKFKNMHYRTGGGSFAMKSRPLARHRRVCRAAATCSCPVNCPYHIVEGGEAERSPTQFESRGANLFDVEGMEPASLVAAAFYVPVAFARTPKPFFP